MIHIKEIGEVMSTWSKATYEMVADTLSLFGFPMMASGCASEGEFSDIHENQLGHQFDTLVVKFSMIFEADNPNFSPARFKETIQDKGSKYFHAYILLNEHPDHINDAMALGQMLTMGGGSDDSYKMFTATLERLIKELAANPDYS